MAAEVAGATLRMRELDLIKPPGVAESLDWASALAHSAPAHWTRNSHAVTLGAVLKYREDADRVRNHRHGRNAGQVSGAGPGM